MLQKVRCFDRLMWWYVWTLFAIGLACVYVQLSGFECGKGEDECTFDITQHAISDLTAIAESESAIAAGK